MVCRVPIWSGGFPEFFLVWSSVCLVQCVTNIFEYNWSIYLYGYLSANIFKYLFEIRFWYGYIWIYSFVQFSGHNYIPTMVLFNFSGLCQKFRYKYIWIFVRVIFLIRIYSDIRSCQKCSYEYIRIFVRIIFLTRIYSDIRSYQNPYECHTLVWLHCSIPPLDRIQWPTVDLIGQSWRLTSTSWFSLLCTKSLEWNVYWF